MRLANKTPLITGGSSGIGLATAGVFLQVVDGGITGAPYGAPIHTALTEQ